MVDWGKGYVTDIEYVEKFYEPLTPQHLALAAIVSGFEPPEIDGHFAYCELGCARGLTSLILAAVNPKAAFHAIDFNPASIAHALSRARAAGLDNITFHERSFEVLTEPSAGLPMFDIVTMHGVWSWISPELQRALIAFLRSHLKPGGLVYVSYNALPAWNDIMPVQRVLRELTATQHTRSDQAAGNALAMINRLAEKKIIPPRFQDGLNRLNHAAKGQDLTYLVHEFLPAGWAPYYFADVARALGEAKLNYVGSAKLLHNFWNLALNEEQRALISEIEAPEIRETLKDFCINNQFRQDIFVRGARPMPAPRRQSLLNTLSFALTAPAPEIIDVTGPTGKVLRADMAVYRPILEALERRPHSVAELLSLPGLPRPLTVGTLDLVAMLISSGAAMLWRGPNREAEARAALLNDVLGDFPSPGGATVAVPTLGLGLALSPAEFVVYATLRRGAKPDASAIAARLVGFFRSIGGHPMVDGKPVENEAEALAAVTKECETKIAKNVPIWRALGMVPA